MARSLVVALSLTVLAAAQSVTLNQPAETVCSSVNFTWTYSGFTGLQIPATNLSLSLFPVAGENSTLATTLSGVSVLTTTASPSSATTRTPTVSPSTTSKILTTSTTPLPAGAVTLTTYSTTILEASATTVTVGGGAITVPLEVPVATHVVATVTNNVVHGRRLSSRQSLATVLLNAPLSADSYVLDTSTITEGWYILVAVTVSSLKIRTVVANTTAFYIEPSCPAASSGLSGGAIAGIVVGVVLAVLALLVLGIWYFRKRRAARRASTTSDWAAGMNGEVFQSQWRRSLGRDRPANGANGQHAEDWETVKNPQSVPLSPMAGVIAVGYGSNRGKHTQVDPFAEKEDERGSGSTSVDATVSRQSSMADHTHSQPLQQHTPFPSVGHPYSPHPYNPYLYSPGSTPPATGPLIVGGSAKTTPREQPQEPWSFFESTSTSPRESGTTQGRISRDRARVSQDSVTLPPPSSFFPRRGSGPTPVVMQPGGTTTPTRARSRTQSSQAAPPLPISNTEASRSASDLPAAAASHGSPPGLGLGSSPELEGAPLAKSTSGSLSARGPAGARRKPVPVYQPEAGLPSPAPSHSSTPPRLSLPPSSPFLEDDNALAPADTRKSSLSTSGAGVDPSVSSSSPGDMPVFAGQKEAMHVLIPDMPAEYLGRR